ncbi:MAG TPA: glycosyltransferase [Cyanobacteria bacterium UBA11372]|nr:glycosyltransferase [Cyanobacteria bacterium UBA11372]
MQQSYSLLGIQVNPLTIPELNALIANAVEFGDRRIIANHNLHSIYLYHHDAKMRSFFAKAHYTHIDGMALVLVGRLLGYPLKRDHRVTYVDWTAPLMAEAAQQGWRIFYLGGKPGVAEKGAKILQQRFPGLEIVTADGYFDARPESPENLAILDRINAYKPHILMVGMSMPRQERWVLDNFDRLNTNTILTAGATLDYAAGAVPTPPRWAGKLGLEWLFRLVAEPKRLWRRYLVEPWFLFFLLVADIFKVRVMRKRVRGAGEQVSG